MKENKPCPICGANSEISSIDDDYRSERLYLIKCSKCLTYRIKQSESDAREPLEKQPFFSPIIDKDKRVQLQKWIKDNQGWEYTPFDFILINEDIL